MHFSLVGVLLVKIFILFYFKMRVQSDCQFKYLCYSTMYSRVCVSDKNSQKQFKPHNFVDSWTGAGFNYWSLEDTKKGKKRF